MDDLNRKEAPRHREDRLQVSDPLSFTQSGMGWEIEVAPHVICSYELPLVNRDLLIQGENWREIEVGSQGLTYRAVPVNKKCRASLHFCVRQQSVGLHEKTSRWNVSEEVAAKEIRSRWLVHGGDGPELRRKS
jgi:hypothetical protein